MADVHDIGEKGGDARHRPVERALEEARAAHDETPASRAIVVLAWVDGDGIRVRPHCAGVEVTQALGLLELAKHELLYGDPD
jgi:hypothetical protein